MVALAELCRLPICAEVKPVLLRLAPLLGDAPRVMRQAFDDHAAS